MERLRILYRGSLSACNYSCNYCPFADKRESKENLLKDMAELGRFLCWAAEQKVQLEILFTPLGEALIHKHYQQAIIQLSHLSNVKKVAVQTNLSGDLKWTEHVNRSSFALWCSFHPSQVPVNEFLGKCNYLLSHQISFSAGCVGVKENFDSILKLRSMLPPSVYLWINAFKHTNDYYTAADVELLRSVDPLFDYNNRVYSTFGKACVTGHTAFTLTGNGDVTRCHFNKELLGNIYTSDIKSNLYPRACTNETCHCYIGYIFLEEPGFEKIYGDRLLERIYKDSL